MTVQDAIDEIFLLVKSKQFFTLADGETIPSGIVRRINSVVASACSQPGIEIPALRKLGQFTTDTIDPYAAIDGISANFSGKILTVGDPSKGIKVYGSLDDLYTDYYPLTNVGDVEAVCIADNIVWYQGIPETPTDILCILQDAPPAVSSATDDIPIIPEFLQLQIVVHGVAAWLYDNIEDGVDSNKNNTENSRAQFAAGIQKWREFLGSRRQHNKTSHWRY